LLAGRACAARAEPFGAAAGLGDLVASLGVSSARVSWKSGGLAGLAVAGIVERDDGGERVADGAQAFDGELGAEGDLRLGGVAAEFGDEGVLGAGDEKGLVVDGGGEMEERALGGDERESFLADVHAGVGRERPRLWS
jgi:hypothetical protein